jgi:hypothetical protein
VRKNGKEHFKVGDEDVFFVLASATRMSTTEHRPALEDLFDGRLVAQLDSNLIANDDQIGSPFLLLQATPKTTSMRLLSAMKAHVVEAAGGPDHKP